MKNRYDIFLIVLLCSLCLGFTAKAQPVPFNHTYGSMQYNYGRRIIEAGDRGFYILGNVSANSGNSNIHIIRTDSLGIIMFEKNIGDGPVYWANDFIRTSDQGFLICGLTDKLPGKGYDMLLIKTDSNINVEWERYYGGAGWDIANAIIETKDSAYLMAGLTYSYGGANENIYIVKTNFLGDTLWTKTFGGDSSDYATSADVCFDGTYLIGATTNSFGFGDFDGYVLNLDLNGDTIWAKNYGEDKEDIIYSIKQTPDTGFVFVGSTTSYNAIQHENWLMKFDKNRNFQWKMPEAWDIGPADDVLFDVNLTDSSHYLLTGYTTYGDGSKNLSLIVMRDNLNFKCSVISSSSSDDVGYQVIQAADKGYAIIGYTAGFGPALANILLIRYGNDCSYSTTYEQIVGMDESPDIIEYETFGIYPTVSEGKFNINLKENAGEKNFDVRVINILGQIVSSHSIQVQAGTSIEIDISRETDGVYFVTLSDSEKVFCYKVVKCGK